MPGIPGGERSPILDERIMSQPAKERTMRIAVIGAGRTGGYFGGLLANAGREAGAPVLA